MKRTLSASGIDETRVRNCRTAEASDIPALATTKKEQEPFDIIFFDPPYSSDYESSELDCGYGGQLLTDDGVVIVEHYKKKELPEEFGSLKRYRTLKQGDSVLSFFTKSVTPSSGKAA